MLLLALAACGGDATSPNTNDGNGNNNGNGNGTVRNVPGSYTRTITIGGVSRQFVVHVGSSVGATTAAPVVFMFHGSGGDGPQYFNISRWKEKADASGLIAVFPSALTYCWKEDQNGDGDMTDAGELQVESHWDSGKINTADHPLCTPAEVAARSASERALLNHGFQSDLAFVDSMIVALKSSLVVDAKKIYATGFSNGAQMCTRLILERSSTFASIHMHGGGAELTGVASRTITAAGSLGSKDQHVQEAFGITELPMTSDMFTRYPGVKARYVSPILQMLQLQDVSPTFSQVTLSGKLVSQWTWRTSAVGASNSFVFSLVADNDHAYPNGTLHPIVLAEPLWQFFAPLALP